MDKLKMHSPDLSQDNIAKIRALFPDCVTEATDDHGTVRLAVDFDQLRQTLSDNIVEGPQERYRLDWPGKREALLTANAPIAKTLRPTREESVNFDTTRNLFIEGDNLDALKLIQESYLGKVKLIYIDPPYNTGSDFIYRDDYSQSTPEFLVRSNQADEAGGRLVANSESNGRFHSDWLSMMYARLKLARNLLSTDGAIFVSIDDNERDNLKKIMDEIFGEDNFIVPIIWQKRITPENRRAFSFEHDYILCYARSAQEFVETRQLLPLTDEARARYKNPDSDSRGDWQSVPAIAQAGHATKSQFYKLETPDGRMLDPPEGCCWRYTKDRMQKEIQDNRIWFGSDGKGVPRIKRFLDETNQGITPGTIWFAKDVRANEHAKKDLSSIFDGKVIFDSPKPTQLIERIIEIATTGSESDIIVDFFAGSGTAAHAVLGVNARDGGRRKFISIQLPECLTRN
jgi:adenine-specific DNA-methyltransferase